MNGLDIIIAFCFIISFFIGWKLRALHLLGFALAICISIWCANHLYIHFIDYFKDMSDTARHTFAWISVFVFILLVTSLFFNIASKRFESSNWKWLDHIFGACIGCIVMFCLTSFALYLFNYWAPKNYTSMVEHSSLTPALIRYSQPFMKNLLEKYPQLKMTLPKH